MAIKMIVTDLDRTLLRDDKTISGYTEKTLLELKKRGIPFVIATARPIRAVRQWLSFLRYDAAVFHNGAVVMLGGEVIGRFGLENTEGIAAAILKGIPGSRITVEAGDWMYSNMPAEKLWPGVQYTRTEDFRETRGLLAEKVIVTAHTPEEMAALEPYTPQGAYLQLSENTIAMMMNRAATKLNGIRLLAERYGIGLGETAAFGDDYNDIDMLSACGKGVAVENALPEVKAAANEVCGSSEEDGVARWIWDNVLT